MRHILRELSGTDMCVLFGRPHRSVDGDDRFEIEAFALEELGIESYALPLDPIVNGEPERAVRRLPRPSGRRWLYRGWMLNEEEYTALHEAIADRDEELVVDPESFALATYAPSYLPLLGEHAAPARWTEGEDVRQAWDAALELGAPPWVVKDHVKSAKESWHRACFVPPGADFDDFASICERLVELRGDRFERGFVVKKYVELATLPGWTPERRRVTDEHRLVFWRGRLVAHAPYYDVDSELESPERFGFLGRLVDSPFFTADVARLASGGYTVIELNYGCQVLGGTPRTEATVRLDRGRRPRENTNDGGCSVLPERLDPREMYRAIVALE